MEKSIKLVAFDMDGTVLDSKLRLPKGLFEMIESHPNVKFVVARQGVGNHPVETLYPGYQSDHGRHTQTGTR